MIRCNLGRLLGERQMRMAELARRTGIAKNTLSALYHSRGQGIQYQTLAKLCRIFHCSVGDLLEFVPDEHDDH